MVDIVHGEVIDSLEAWERHGVKLKIQVKNGPIIFGSADLARTALPLKSLFRPLDIDPHRP